MILHYGLKKYYQVALAVVDITFGVVGSLVIILFTLQEQAIQRHYTILYKTVNKPLNRAMS